MDLENQQKDPLLGPKIEGQKTDLPSVQNQSRNQPYDPSFGEPHMGGSSEDLSKTQVFDAYSEEESDSVRAKSSLRLRYEAEVELIKKKLGGLEAIRETLGLSQRKMTQLLLVDPSAWTRWTRGPAEDAPPHIYRALQWYLAIQDKYPALDVNFWLANVSRQADHIGNERRDQKLEQVTEEIERLRREIERLKAEALEKSRAESHLIATLRRENEHHARMRRDLESDLKALRKRGVIVAGVAVALAVFLVLALFFALVSRR